MKGKAFLRNVPLYLLTFANIIYGITHGVNWLFFVAIILSAIVLILDIIECTTKKRK